MSAVEKFVTGVIAIGLVTAFGLHAAGLATLVKNTGQAGAKIEGSAING